MISLHETCKQYVARRLSEGWQIVKQEGYGVILQSPEGIIRPVDLRNDVETLRPNVDGDEKNIASTIPPAHATHYDLVYEAVPDETTTCVYTVSATLQRDLYEIADPTFADGATINKITVFARCWQNTAPPPQNYCRIYTKSDSTIGDSGVKALSNTWTPYSHEWALNPADSEDWEKADITALQIGVGLQGDGTWGAYCTQVYVEVDYEPVAPPTKPYIPHCGPRKKRTEFFPTLSLGG